MNTNFRLLLFSSNSPRLNPRKEQPDKNSSLVALIMRGVIEMPTLIPRKTGPLLRKPNHIAQDTLAAFELPIPMVYFAY